VLVVAQLVLAGLLLDRDVDGVGSAFVAQIG
jgi:hypothetical protein